MRKTIRRYLLNSTILIGIGTLIVTHIPFFAKGGFGKMTTYTSLYIIGLVIGVAMILYGLFKQVSQDKKDKQTGKDKVNPKSASVVQKH